MESRGIGRGRLSVRPLQFTSGGEVLHGYLFSAEGATALPCVCIAPGARGFVRVGAGGDGLLQVAESLKERGFAVFAFDGRGMGGEHPSFPRSGGSRKAQGESLEDLHAALMTVALVREVDSQRVGVFGESVGGAAAAFAAARGAPLKSIVLWGTPPSYAECIERGTLDPWATGVDPSLGLLNVAEVLNQVQAHTLVAGGCLDNVFSSVAQQERVFAGLSASASTSVLRVGGARHEIDARSSWFPWFVEVIDGWFKTTL